jgi:hypothetical protein
MAGTREITHEPGADDVISGYDWYLSGCSLRGTRPVVAEGHDHVDVSVEQFCREFTEALRIRRESNLDHEILALGVARFFEPLA